MKQLPCKRVKKRNEMKYNQRHVQQSYTPPSDALFSIGMRSSSSQLYYVYISMLAFAYPPRLLAKMTVNFASVLSDVIILPLGG